jgi:hypothetical protein
VARTKCNNNSEEWVKQFDVNEICHKECITSKQKEINNYKKEMNALKITKQTLNKLENEQIIDTKTNRILTIEGEIPIFVFYKDFLGIEMNDEKFKMKKNNKIEISEEFKQIYLESCNILLKKNIEVNEETLLHYTAGIVKVMNTGKSKNEAKQIVSDLNDKFGIIHFGRHSPEQLLFQHNSVEWINCPDGTRNGKIKLNGSYPEIVAFLDSAYENKGTVYKYNETKKMNVIQNQINIMNTIGPVFIYEVNEICKVNESVKDIEKTLKTDLEENTNFSIVMRGHGEIREITLDKNKNENNILTANDNVNLSSFDSIYILACSTGKIIENYTNLAKELSIKFPNSLIFAPNFEFYETKETTNLELKNEIQKEIEKQLNRKISKIPFVYMYSQNYNISYGIVLFLNGKYYRNDKKNLHEIFK